MLGHVVLVLLPVAILLTLGFLVGAFVVWAWRVPRPRYRRSGALS